MKTYIANDIECSGGVVGTHSVLSWGACVVTSQEEMSHDEYVKNGMTFYTEFQPLTHNYEIEAMRVGCVGLRCLTDMDSNPRHNPISKQFDPESVLQVLSNCGETVQNGVNRFVDWVNAIRKEDTKIVPVVDTVFYDSGFIQHIFGIAERSSPYGWSGLDLDSLYRGYSRDMSGNLRELGIIDNRRTKHNALDDAMFLADMARELIFKRIGN